MRVYLMRHGKAMSGADHPYQPLSAEGRAEVEASAKYIKSKKLKFDVIISSPKLRAEETAEIVAETVGYPTKNIVKTDTLKPGGTPEEIFDFLSKYNDRNSILLTGHMPSMPRLASAMIGVSIEVPFPTACLYQVDIKELPGDDGDLLLLYTPPE